jgi:hypothetical protein
MRIPTWGLLLLAVAGAFVIFFSLAAVKKRYKAKWPW